MSRARAIAGNVSGTVQLTAARLIFRARFIPARYREPLARGLALRGFLALVLASPSVTKGRPHA